MNVTVTFSVVPSYYPFQGLQALPFPVDRWHFRADTPDDGSLEAYGEWPHRPAFATERDYLNACKLFTPLADHAAAFFQSLIAYHTTGEKL